jgi:hypothetical protein
MRHRFASGDFIRRIRSAARLMDITGRSGLWMACSLAPGPGTTSTTRVRYITGRITSAACGIRIASMIATGSFSAIRGSTIGDSENSTSMILIVDAGSMKRGNFTDVILIAVADLTTDAILTVGVGPERIGAAISTAARRIGAGDMSAAKVVGAITDEDEQGRLKMGWRRLLPAIFVCV